MSKCYRCGSILVDRGDYSECHNADCTECNRRETVLFRLRQFRMHTEDAEHFQLATRKEEQLRDKWYM